MSCTSAKVCTAVGFQVVDGRHVPLAERWNGTSWSIQRTPKPAGSTSSALVDVSCTSRTFCIALGSLKGGSGTFVERWDGSRWSIHRIPKGLRAIGVSCTSKTACIAVGGGPYTDGLFQFFSVGSSAARWNGSTWSLEPTPKLASAGGLSAVSCASATACLAVGYGPGRNGNYGTLGERWAGTTWSVQRTPTPGGLEDWLWGVSCASAVGCAAVGDFVADTSYDTEPVVERWNGRRWSMQRTPALPPSPASLLGYGNLSHVSCAATNACMAVGTINYPEAAGPTTVLAERWDGSRWTIQATENPGTATSSELNGVSCTSAVTCIAVGSFTNSVTKRVTLVERYS